MMMGKGIMRQAEKAAAEMVETGEKIRELKLGMNGKIYISPDESLIKWVKVIEENGTEFFIGAKK